MKRLYPLLFSALLCLPPVLADITVKPAGLQVIWEDGGKQFGGFKTFNASQGINLELHLSSDAASFVDLDEDDSKLRIGGVEASCMFFGQKHDFSEDKKVMRVKFDATGAKAEGGKIKVEGHLSVLTGSKTGTAETPMVEWEKGTRITFPEEAKLPEFEITEIGKPAWGDMKWAVTIQAKKDFQTPIRVHFVEADGTRHEAKKAGSSRMSFGRKVSIDQEYQAGKKIEKAKMVVEYWKDLKKEKVPLNLELGL